MDVHRFTGDAPRAALAALVLVATFLVSLWIGTYQEVRGVGTGLLAFRYTPDWTVPVAIAVGVAGTLLALQIYRQGRQR